MERIRPVKIVVPVDYSDISRTACRYAFKIATRLKAEIELFHAYYSPAMDLIEFAGSDYRQNQLKSEVIPGIEENERVAIESFKSEILREAKRLGFNVSIKCIIVQGIPEEEIIDYTREVEPDLVIMGTKNRPDRHRMIFSSITEIVLNKIRVPLMMIPQNYSFIGLENIQNMLFVTHFDESDFQTIDKLMTLISGFELRIHCVHLENRPQNTWDNVKLKGLEEHLRVKYNKTNTESTIIDSKNLLKNLDEYIIDKNINVIALTTRKRSLFQKLFRTGITRKIFYHTNLPLFVFHS
ncbi:MAG: universal stress protein [Bacteroidota bacterium]